MSWLFGRKKQQKDSPPDSTEEEANSEQGEGFVHVPNWPASVPSNYPQGTAAYPSSNMYPQIPPVAMPTGQALPSDSSKDFNQGDGSHYLNGVPFKMCKRLANNMNNDLDIDKLRISEILSFVDRIENQNYDYSFSVEESVVAEMNSRTDE